MRRIRKKELGRWNHRQNNDVQPDEPIEELVDVDGSPIEGDRNAVSNSEIEVPPGQTTDDFVQTARQPDMGFDGMYGGGTPYSHGRRFVAAETSKAKEILTRILKENKKK